jgi:hypothetical protein
VFEASTRTRRAARRPAASPAPAQSQPQLSAKALAQRREAHDRLVSLRETGQILNIHEATVRRLIKAKKLMAVRVAARRIGVRMSSIQRHIDANEMATICA